MRDPANFTNIRALFGALAEAMNRINADVEHHHEQTAYLAHLIAREMGLPEDMADLCVYAALLHDVGKLKVQRSILEKPAHLDVAEYDVIREHPYYTRRREREHRAGEGQLRIKNLQDARAGRRDREQRQREQNFPLCEAALLEHADQRIDRHGKVSLGDHFGQPAGAMADDADQKDRDQIDLQIEQRVNRLCIHDLQTSMQAGCARRIVRYFLKIMTGSSGADKQDKRGGMCQACVGFFCAVVLYYSRMSYR